MENESFIQNYIFDEWSYWLVTLAVLIFVFVAFGPWTNLFWKRVWSDPGIRYKRIRMTVFVVLAVSASIKALEMLSS